MPTDPPKTYDPAGDLPESEAISKKHYDDLAKKIDDSNKENKRQHGVLTKNGNHVKKKQAELQKEQAELKALLLEIKVDIDPILSARKDLDGWTATMARILKPVVALVIALGALAASLKSIQWVLEVVRQWK